MSHSAWVILLKILHAGFLLITEYFYYISSSKTSSVVLIDLTLTWQLCSHAAVTWAGLPAVFPATFSHKHDTKRRVYIAYVVIKKNLPIEHFSVPVLSSSVSALRLYLSLWAALWALSALFGHGCSAGPSLLNKHHSFIYNTHYETLHYVCVCFKSLTVRSGLAQRVRAVNLRELNRHFRQSYKQQHARTQSF